MEWIASQIVAKQERDVHRVDPAFERLFLPDEVPLIAGLIARDAPFYDATISPEAIDGLNKVARAGGLITEPVAYEAMVATQFRDLWRG